MENRVRISKTIILAALLCPLLITGCAEVPKDRDDRADYYHNHDPAEPTNRKIFAFNKYIDDHVLKPVARAYKNDVPAPVQESIHNFVGNLREPQIAFNDVLQGNFRRAGDSSERFVLNTAFGVAGLFDVAAAGGILPHESDFGQTFGVWGIGSGPFVELPILGPSSVRDTAGVVVGAIANPFGSGLGQPAVLTDIGYVGTGLGIINGRAELLHATDNLEANSLDYYATLRTVYQQRREAQVQEGKNPDEKSHKGQDVPNGSSSMVVQ